MFLGGVVIVVTLTILTRPFFSAYFHHPNTAFSADYSLIINLFIDLQFKVYYFCVNGSLPEELYVDDFTISTSFDVCKCLILSKGRVAIWLIL